MITQAGLFDAPISPRSGPPPLRDYQMAACDAVEQELLENRGTLVLCATGTGKTQIAAELIRRSPGRCLFVAHRDELIQQASKRIEQFTGEWPDIEQAEIKAESLSDKNVVASVQTLSRPNRLERFDPMAFSLIVIDEVHHGTSKTYRRIIDYFTAKLVGLTATPDRTDKEALSQILDSVAFRYDVLDAIRDGWLCNVVMRRIVVGSMDFSQVHTVAGDFNQEELAKILEQEENLHAIAKPAVECAGDRKTIVFAASVAQCERLAEIIDRYKGIKNGEPGGAFVVHGGTDKKIRRKLLKEFHDGRYQFFCNVGIATEGYDEPGVSCIVMGRPTKSRSLYVQMLGRGTRGGTKCSIPGKSDALILDFVGNTGRHEIMCVADALGGQMSDQEIAEAEAVIEKSERPMSLAEAADEAKRIKEEERLKKLAEYEDRKVRARENIKGEVVYAVEDFNPYTMFGVKRDYMAEKYGMDPASQKQVDAISRFMKGKHIDQLPAQLSRHEASRLLQQFVDRAKNHMATYGQIDCLAKKGLDARNWRFEQASAVIQWSADHRWQKPPADVIDGIIRMREPGED